MASKVFCDPIHGHIELHPLLLKIIDTPEFQRLRYIKQLGGCYFVFPGAVHSRFEHSIGVCHLAGELVETLRANQGDKLKINDKDVLCVKIAGLCHDLGHGPFSHMFEGFMRKANKSKNWKHEDASVQMFKHLIDKNNLRSELLKQLSEDDLEFIEDLITPPTNSKNDGRRHYNERTKEKEFLYQIVANKKNGIDVDKWDYFARDCHYLGVKTNFDYRRFMKFVRVIEVDNGEQLICTRDKEVATAYEMFHTRYTLHRIAYQHKTTKIIEHMICDAFLMADKHMHLSSDVDDMSRYTKLTDHVFHKILDYSGDDDDMKKSQELLINIQKRKIYKPIGQARPKKKDKETTSDAVPISSETSLEVDDPVVDKTDEEIASDIVALNPTDSKTSLIADDLAVDIVTFNYGKGANNPIASLWFYRKNNPDEAKQYKKDEVPFLLPKKFQVQQILVYCKAFDDVDKTDAAKDCFKKWCKKNGFFYEDQDTSGTLQDQATAGTLQDQATPGTLQDQATPGTLQDQATPRTLQDQATAGTLQDQATHRRKRLNENGNDAKKVQKVLFKSDTSAND